MLAYNPEKFASLYAAEIGQQLWGFLSLPENIARLETASELGKTAVEGIEELLEVFSKDMLVDRVKQMILEQRDWVLEQSDVKVRSVPFMKAYRWPDWFTFHAFCNTSDPHDVAITDRRQNVPSQLGCVGPTMPLSLVPSKLRWPLVFATPPIAPAGASASSVLRRT